MRPNVLRQNLSPTLADERKKRVSATALRGFMLYREGLFPHCKIHATATQDMTNATNTKITFNTTDKDVPADDAGGHADAAMADLTNDRIVIRRAGYYTVKAAVAWDDDNAAGVRLCNILLNGATIIARAGPIAGSTLINVITECSVDLDLDEDDYIELWGQQNSGASTTGSEAITGYPWLSVLWKGL
jgi:hypothetical protein